MIRSLAFLAALPVATAHAQTAPLPLAPARALEFTAREATWMQLDLSPDGRTILFDLLGDIYALDAAGGTARPLLTGMAFERNPVFSPDGKRIAFISDRSGVTNLWVANADGSGLRQLSQDTALTLYTSPTWSPDGRSVYVSRAVHSVLAFELWQFPAAGGAGTVVVKAQPNGDDDWDKRVNAMGAVISPDGRYAYYATKHGHTWTEGDPPNWTIARRDLAEGTDEPFLTPLGGAIAPQLSHDGKQIAYATREGGRTALRLRNLETGEDRRIAFPLDRDGQEGGYYNGLLPRFVFAPDDRSIVLSVDGGIRRLDLASGRVAPIAFEAPVRLDLAASTRVRQREETGPVRPRIAQAPKLSPDGRQIAFTALGALYVQRDGRAPQKLVSEDAYQPSWSPDGRTLTFVTWNPAGGGLWTVPATGGTPRRLASGAFFTEPLFTPDGRAIVAMRANHHDRLRALTELEPDRPTDIVRFSAAGGQPSLLAHVAGARSPAFTRDGRLWFYGAGALRSLDPASGAARSEVSLVARAMGQYVGVPLPVQDAQVSPDGTRILARAASQLYLVDMPARTGGKPATVNVSIPGAARARLTREGADFFGWAQEGASITWSVGSTFRTVPAKAAESGGTGMTEAAARSASLTIEVPRDVPQGTLVLRGATVLPMEGEARIDNADVVITGNRIAAVGRTGTVPVPAGATIRDVRGRFIVPGFIDAHAHFFGIRRGVHERGYWEFLANLAFGVTSTLELQPFTTDIFAYQDMIDAGMMPGPRVWSTGPGVFVNSEIDSRQAALDVLRRYREHYRTRNIKAYMVGDRAARQFTIQAAQELGMMPTTEGASDLVLGLTHAIDGFAGNEHSLPVTPLRDDVVRLMARTRIGYTPTISVLYGGGPGLFDFIIRKHPEQDAKLRTFTPAPVLAEKLRNRHWMADQSQSWPRFAADALRIQRAGGLVGIGSHGEIQGLGLHWEMQALAGGGATPMEVLRAATIDGATIIGHADDVGSIVPGKFADLVILDADPTVDISNTMAIVAVVKNGRSYDPSSLASDWPEARASPARWFDDILSETPGLSEAD
jgi:imidazolonepropionase-like amidohydrolase/Tol biopolymer transport system component